MSFTVDVAFVNTYKSNIQTKFQQKGSRLRPHVRVESQSAEFDFYDRIGPTAAVEMVGRHSDTVFVGTDHDRRRVALRDFNWADLIDKKDRIRMLADPTSPYTMNAIYAFGRSMDDVLIEAAFGTAYTDKTGSTAVTLPSSQVIGSTYVESGAAAASNLTVGKLRRARYLFGKAEADSEGEADLVAVIDPSQTQSLLRTTEVTSADYNTIKALVAGQIDTFMGFKFIRSNRLPIAGTVRDCLLFEKQGLTLAINSEVEVDVGPRRDKNNTTQVYVEAHFGATRMWEEKVIKCQCDEAA
jgi:hypothetical protein